MLNRDKTKLAIFDEFREDRSLPKFKKKKKSKRNVDIDGVIDTESFGTLAINSRQRFASRFGDANGDSDDIELFMSERSFAMQRAAKMSIFVYFFLYAFARLKFFFLGTREKIQDASAMSVKEFFSSVKLSTSELHNVEGKARNYEAQLRHAHVTGQKALIEQLEEGLEAARAEALLVTIGMKRIVSEETIVDFYKKSKKGLRLDWIENFAQPIPSDIVELKGRLDEHGIFDNYAVLHYDPNEKAFVLTQEQKEAKKDPILFGLIAGKRTLYYVGDWVDETCDLTLDKLMEVSGKDAVSELT